MSTRSLYALFERQLGESPRQYIRRLRLERIRACLEDPGCRVRNLTELALDFGFAHLGRFAEQYRRQFGELPSKPCAGAPSADRHGVQESASDPQATDIPSSTRYLT